MFTRLSKGFYFLACSLHCATRLNSPPRLVPDTTFLLSLTLAPWLLVRICNRLPVFLRSMLQIVNGRSKSWTPPQQRASCEYYCSMLVESSIVTGFLAFSAFSASSVLGSHFSGEFSLCCGEFSLCCGGRGNALLCIPNLSNIAPTFPHAPLKHI